MSNRADFVALMNRYEVNEEDKLAPGIAGIIERPTPGKFFHGKDANDRVFVNLPIQVRLNGERKWTSETLVIYQKFKNEDDRFAIDGIGLPQKFSALSLLGIHFNNFRNLEKLLDGRSIELNCFQTGEMISSGTVQIRTDLPGLGAVIATILRDVFVR